MTSEKKDGNQFMSGWQRFTTQPPATKIRNYHINVISLHVSSQQAGGSMHVQIASNKLYILIYRIQLNVRIPEYPSPAPASMELTASMSSAPLPHPTFRFKSIVEKVRVTELRAEHLLRHAASSEWTGGGGELSFV